MHLVSRGSGSVKSTLGGIRILTECEEWRSDCVVVFDWYDRVFVAVQHSMNH